MPALEGASQETHALRRGFARAKNIGSPPRLKQVFIQSVTGNSCQLHKPSPPTLRIYPNHQG